MGEFGMRGQCCLSLVARQRKSRREVKRAAAAEFAFDPDAPAHQFHQPRGNGQPQAGAAIIAGGRSVGLFKGGGKPS